MCSCKSIKALHAKLQRVMRALVLPKNGPEVNVSGVGLIGWWYKEGLEYAKEIDMYFHQYLTGGKKFITIKNPYDPYEKQNVICGQVRLGTSKDL